MVTVVGVPNVALRSFETDTAALPFLLAPFSAFKHHTSPGIPPPQW